MDSEIIKKFSQKMKNSQISPSESLKNKVLLRINSSDVSSQKTSPMHLPYLKPVLVAAYTFFLVVGGWFLHSTFQGKKVSMTFILYNETAKEIHLAGDFNEWDKQNISMEEENGYWSATVAMKPGVYQYMFVIDSEHWIPDPSNTEVVESAFGGVNSVVEVQEI